MTIKQFYIYLKMKGEKKEKIVLQIYPKYIPYIDVNNPKYYS